MLKKYWIPGLWLLCVPLYAWAGVSPDQYAEAVLHTHPAYPWGGVLSAIAITAVEALVLYAIIRPKTYLRSWKRSAAALLLFSSELLVCAVLLMHQPGYVFAHFLWVLAVNVVLGAMCIYSIVARVVQPSAS
jgi:Ca2+/Na+ antiporter